MKIHSTPTIPCFNNDTCPFVPILLIFLLTSLTTCLDSDTCPFILVLVALCVDFVNDNEYSDVKLIDDYVVTNGESNVIHEIEKM